MFGTKKSLGRIIDLNYTAETFVDKNMTSVREFCHVTYVQDGYVQHAILDGKNIQYRLSDEYNHRMIEINAGGLLGGVKGAEIIIPSNEISE